VDNYIEKHFAIYQNMLKKYNRFSDSPNLWDSTFMYPSIADMHLATLRKTYRLEKLVANNDIDTAKNVMRWVHEALLFSDYAEYSGENIAIDILNFARSNRKTVNCAMHSIVLAEALLSLGITSRSIQCLPLDPIDEDSHFINIAYIQDLKKWIALDPSFSTFFSDGDGKVMNLAELRNAYICNRLPNINRFTRFLEIKEFTADWYIAYLAKNLFRFSCPKATIFNREANVLYFLEPIGYRDDNTEERLNSTIRRYIGDSAFFWGGLSSHED